MMVGAGKKAVFTAQNAPASPVAVDVAAETAWYDGRGKIVSDFGQIAYVVERYGSPISEIWAMNADGSGKHLLKSFLGNVEPDNWMSGQQWLKLEGFVSLCWNAPDYKTRKSWDRSGTPIFWSMPVATINAATGQDGVLELPAGFGSMTSVLSPDGNHLAFINGFPDGKSHESGLWVCDLGTGDVKQLLKGELRTTPAWSPDSRRIAISSAEGYPSRHNMVIIDAETGEVDDLGFNGAQAVFSPDGTKIACVGDTDTERNLHGSWSGGPVNGGVFILDLQSGGNPVRLTEAGEMPYGLMWSPDGSQVMYFTRKVDWAKNRASHGAVLPESYSVKTVNTDGSGSKTIFHEELPTPRFQGCGWADDGRSVYIRKTDGILVIAPDGSGVIANLGGNASDSILPAGEQTQTNAAAKAIGEAVFQYAVGEYKTYEGKVKEARSAYRASADIWASLAWNYPLAHFSVSNIQLYADVAAEKAGMTDKELFEASCQRRLSFLGIRLGDYLRKEKAFPSNLEALRKWSQENGGALTNWMNYKEDVDMAAFMFICPLDGKPYQYTVRDFNTAKVDDVVVTCPNHPKNSVKLQSRWLNR